MSKLLRSWLLFALSVFLLANLMALVLVFLKLPLLPQSESLQRGFARALVLHVDLSILVWALSMVTVVWLCHLPRGPRWLDLTATVLLFGSGAGLLLSIGLYQGQPLLSNYLPVLDAPLYLSSLGVFVVAVILIALPRVGSILSLVSQPLSQAAFRLALLALLVTVAVQLIAWWRLPSLALDLPQAELLFWGAGHSLQAVYLCALLGGWFYLLQRDADRHAAPRDSGAQRIGVLLMLPVVLAPLLISALWAPDDPSYREGFAIWMRLFSLPVVGVILLSVWHRLQGGRSMPSGRTDWRAAAVGLSMLLFFLGVLLGMMIRADNLLVPAHYHATTGAVNLIFMALIYDLAAEHRAPQGLLRQLKSYAAGVVLMVVGLALSGWMGVGRKLAATPEMLNSAAELAAMLLMGCGGAIGLIASFWFVGKALRSLLGVRSRSMHPCTYEVSG